MPPRTACSYAATNGVRRMLPEFRQHRKAPQACKPLQVTVRMNLNGNDDQVNSSVGTWVEERLGGFFGG